jgi:hypothetical protein
MQFGSTFLATGAPAVCMVSIRGRVKRIGVQIVWFRAEVGPFEVPGSRKEDDGKIKRVSPLPSLRS